MDTYLTESFLSPNTGVCGNISMHVNPYGERAAVMPFNPTFFSMSVHVCSVQTHVNRHGERESFVFLYSVLSYGEHKAELVFVSVCNPSIFFFVVETDWSACYIMLHVNAREFLPVKKHSLFIEVTPPAERQLFN